MPEPPKSNASRARATVARSFNRTAQRASLRAANAGRRNARNPTAGTRTVQRTLNARASATSRTASNFARRNNPNLTPPRNGGRRAEAGTNARTRGRRRGRR